MTIAGKILRFLGSSISGVFKSGQNSGDYLTNWLASKSGSELTNAQREQNQFDHDEAELAYQRQIDYYNQFQSPEAMMRQYQSAGLNPAIMMAGGNEGLSSAPQVPQASGSSAGSQTASLADIVQLLSFAKLSESQVNVNNSQAAKNEAEARNADSRTEGQNITNQWLPTQYGTNVENMKANTDLALARVNTEATVQALNRAGVSEKEAQIALTLRQAYLLEIDAETRREMNQADLRLKTIDGDLKECEIRYKTALTSQAWSQVRKINAEIENLHAERQRIVADTERIKADSYGKWLDNKIKSDTLPDIVKTSHFDAEHLQQRFDWEMTSNVGRICKDVEKVSRASWLDFKDSFNAWRSRNNSDIFGNNNF